MSEENKARYYECPECGWLIKFCFNGKVYTSKCPFCSNQLEVDKREYEMEKADTPITFQPDF